jgi:DNA-binding CsgD family transcriptional regulator
MSRRSARALATPGSHTEDQFGAARAVVVLIDPEARPPASEQRIGLIFGLTPGEARLAAQPGAGATIKAAADTLRITRHTARSVLKAVMHMTDTHRQAEPVALIGRIASVADRAASDP